MKEYENGSFTGERALYNIDNAKIINSKFFDGESPLKECKNLDLLNVTFSYKYPLWYSKNIKVSNTTFNLMSRSGIWYTNNITLKDSTVDAPKEFRRCNKVNIINTNFSIADETLWSCKNINIKDSYFKGDYLMMNSNNIKCENIKVDGNYIFDGCSNIEVRNSYLNSKDSFWNCKNAVIYDSTIIGEYIGWNSENLTFVRCNIESIQGFCYVKNLRLIDCNIKDSNLIFEYSTVNANITCQNVSIKNPIKGKINIDKCDEIILDKDLINPKKVKIRISE